MISPAELAEYIATMQAAGITGKAKIGDIKITIPAVVEPTREVPAARRSSKSEYDRMLFAATEGIPEDEDVTS